MHVDGCICDVGGCLEINVKILREVNMVVY